MQSTCPKNIKKCTDLLIMVARISSFTTIFVDNDLSLALS